MNLKLICDRIEDREGFMRSRAPHMTLADHTKLSERLHPRPHITRRALHAIFGLEAMCQEFGNKLPNEDELLELWAILKEEVIDRKKKEEGSG